MNLPYLIAKRYFFSKKKKSFINFISLISMLGVGIGTMALVIVLSVFNGLEDLNRQIFKSFDPDIKISGIEGKFFTIDDSKRKKLSEIEGIRVITEIIQDNALVKYADAQMVVNLKGVDDTFIKNSPLVNHLVDGKFMIKKDSIAYALVGGNVYHALNISLQNIIEPLQIWYPRNQKKLSINPQENINEIGMNISGVYSLENNHDDYVFVPIEIANQLTERPNQLTAYEVQLKEGVNLEKIQKQIKDIFGENFKIQNADEQNAALFRAVRIEKLFIFIALIFIIGIASTNIFSSLTMLAIDKKDDIKTLLSMGAEKSLVRKIFLNEGAIISFSGAIIGLIVGGAICWIQQNFGIIKMGMTSAIVDAYPVKMQFFDFLITTIAIIIITLLASFFPSKKASEF